MSQTEQAAAGNPLGAAPDSVQACYVAGMEALTHVVRLGAERAECQRPGTLVAQRRGQRSTEPGLQRRQLLIAILPWLKSILIYPG